MNELLADLARERNARKPAPYRNPVRDYLAEIEEARAAEDPARVAVRRYEAACRWTENTTDIAIG